jgi:hypothetical protein
MHQREWKGTVVSEKGLTQFFTMGYAASDTSIQPGGFIIFMFKPYIAAIQTASSVALQQGIQSLFGDTKINKDTVQYFAIHEYYLSNSPENLEISWKCVRYSWTYSLQRLELPQPAIRKDYTSSNPTAWASTPSSPMTTFWKSKLAIC